jgi:5-histidylcysteine sulfoxide synthase/putative 4-mercaptohistidine N1-methyltranferase
VTPERGYTAQALQTKSCVAPFQVPRPSVPTESRTKKPVVRSPILDEDVWLTGPRSSGWFTGVAPENCPGFNIVTQQLQSLPLPNLSNCTRESALAYFNNTWTITELLFSSLQSSEAFLRSPDHGLRHPLIFYYGHPAVLYINKLCVAGLLPHGVNGFMEDHFETGVDEMSWDDMSKNEHPWPRVSEVRAYRETVYEIMVNLINKHLPSASQGGITVNQSHPLWALYLGFEHERIHHETSSVLIRETPLKFVLRPRFWVENHFTGRAVIQPDERLRFESIAAESKPVVAGIHYPVNELVPVRSQTVTLGKPADFPSFGWDNEYGSTTVKVGGISVAKNMVTNGEMLEFVRDNGYTDSKWWSKAGWEWRQFRNAKWPKFWQRLGPQGRNCFGLRTMFEVVEMPWNWPAMVNHMEGQAYCNWYAAKTNTKLRFMTEAEHHAIRDDSMQLPIKAVAQDPVLNGKLMVEDGFNTNLCVGSESPVMEHKANSGGFYDVMGNAWEWTDTWFHGMDGFKPHPVYEDFSVPCFDNRHNMIMGGSWASSGANGSSLFSRFAFRPHFHQHAGFRYAHDTGVAVLATTAAAATVAVASSTPQEEGQQKYETSAQISAYLSLHFGQCAPCAQYTVLPQAPKFRANLSHALQFPQRTAELLADACSRLKGARVGLHGTSAPTRALDIGCAVGGASFELTKFFDQVVGVDYAQGLVQAANAVKTGALTHAAVTLNVAGEGETVSKALTLTGVGSNCTCLSGVDAKRVSFLVGDATALPSLKELTGSEDARFDAVLLANLLCRLPEPLKCLDRLPLIVRPGGVVLFVSPYSWLEQFTKKEHWFGGFVKSGSAVSSADTLVAEMKSRGFELIETQDMPLLIPDHARKFQYIVSNACLFQKKF